MLNNPRSTERDNQNALRKFPFSDAASCTNGACVIPSGAIIDAQLYVPGREPGRVWLSGVDAGGRLHFSDAAGEFAETSAPAAPDTAVPVTFTGDGGPCPGGVIVFGVAADVASLASLGGQKFTSAQAELAPAAVSWPGLPGVFGFKLDDGHTVYGDVKMRGANGCTVATYVDSDGLRRLRISAVGREVESVETTGFVTKVIASSDNTTFAVARNPESAHVIDITATGVATLQDDKRNADQNELCSQVRKKAGTVPSQRSAGGLPCGDAVCASPDPTLRKITLMGQNGSSSSQVVWTESAADSYIPVMLGDDLGKLLSSQLPTPPSGKRFAGYFDAAAKTPGETLTLYYRYDGTGVGRFALDHDITLYAHFIDASSYAEVEFNGYGTLHLAAPNLTTYANPITISGLENPVPVVHEHTDKTLSDGGADALAELVLSPTVPAGEVHIGLRGANKISLL